MWNRIDRNGTGLAYKDFGGQGPTVVLLHGLAGHADEWTRTTSWLTASHSVVAPDARGHGRSERRPDDLSPEAMVEDVVAILEDRQCGSVVLVGQSFGGLTAMTLAAQCPELVQALVVIEASPEGGGTDIEPTVEGVVRGLRSWPVPFVALEAAESFFTDRFGSPLAGQAWASGLDQRADGWWPWFDPDVLGVELKEALTEDRWGDWDNIRCPILVVLGDEGIVDADVVAEMARRQPDANVVEVLGAGHDVHLDQPEPWREALTGFIQRYGL